MRLLLYVVLSVLVALGANFTYGFACGALGVFFPRLQKVGGGAVVFYSVLALGLIYSRSRLNRGSRVRPNATTANPMISHEEEKALNADC